MLSRNKIAAVFTVLYLAGIVLVVWFKGTNPFSLKLNELGDFAAGAFGPLAFAWLIFGYLQQGEELRQNTVALKEQGEELRNSVEQQQRLAEISLEALQLEKEQRLSQEERYRESCRPILMLGSARPSMTDGKYELSCYVYNDGAQIYGVEVYNVTGNRIEHAGSVRTLDKGSSTPIHILWDPTLDEGDVLVDVLYRERGDIPGVARFKMVSSIERGQVMFAKCEDFSS